MITVLICTVFGVFIMFSFVFGVKVGQSTVRGEKVEIQTPIKAIKEHKEQKEINKQDREIEIMLQNIDNYDGTGMGQKEIR